MKILYLIFFCPVIYLIIIGHQVVSVCFKKFGYCAIFHLTHFQNLRLYSILFFETSELSVRYVVLIVLILIVNIYHSVF